MRFLQKNNYTGTLIFSRVLLIACAVLIDQLVKQWFFVFSPEKIFKNYGIIFSLPLESFLSVPISIIFFAVVAFYFLKSITDKQARESFAFALILAGALGNILDRATRGFVIDYINVTTGSFNLADIFIVLGAALYLYLTYKKPGAKIA